MEPIINLEETPGKTVGRRRPPKDPIAASTLSREDARRWSQAFGNGIPRGVYRFKSHEEADAWMMKMLAGRKNR